MHGWRNVFASQVVPLQEVSSLAYSYCFKQSALSLLSFAEDFVNMNEDLADIFSEKEICYHERRSCRAEPAEMT